MARDTFVRDGKVSIKGRLLEQGTPERMREWLIENINGFGPKEASHFLRNIGFGADLGILDVHILKNLAAHGVIDEVPKSMTRKKYAEIEGRMREFASEVGIPFAELDLVLWSKETGIIFK